MSRSDEIKILIDRLTKDYSLSLCYGFSYKKFNTYLIELNRLFIELKEEDDN